MKLPCSTAMPLKLLIAPSKTSCSLTALLEASLWSLVVTSAKSSLLFPGVPDSRSLLLPSPALISGNPSPSSTSLRTCALTLLQTVMPLLCGCSKSVLALRSPPSLSLPTCAFTRTLWTASSTLYTLTSPFHTLINISWTAPSFPPRMTLLMISIQPSFPNFLVNKSLSSVLTRLHMVNSTIPWSISTPSMLLECPLLTLLSKLVVPSCSSGTWIPLMVFAMVHVSSCLRSNHVSSGAAYWVASIMAVLPSSPGCPCSHLISHCPFLFCITNSQSTLPFP